MVALTRTWIRRPYIHGRDEGGDEHRLVELKTWVPDQEDGLANSPNFEYFVESLWFDGIGCSTVMSFGRANSISRCMWIPVGGRPGCLLGGTVWRCLGFRFVIVHWGIYTGTLAVGWLGTNSSAFCAVSILILILLRSETFWVRSFQAVIWRTKITELLGFALVLFFASARNGVFMYKKANRRIVLDAWSVCADF